MDERRRAEVLWVEDDSNDVAVASRAYIAVGLSNDPRGPQWLERLIVAFDGIVFGSAA